MHSHLYSFALRFLSLQNNATSYSFLSSDTVHCKGERMENLIENYIPLSNGLRNPYRNLKSENCQDYAQKPQRNCICWERKGRTKQMDPGFTSVYSLSLCRQSWAVWERENCGDT
jgi:hypothetical protein